MSTVELPVEPTDRIFLVLGSRMLLGVSLSISTETSAECTLLSISMDSMEGVSLSVDSMGKNMGVWSELEESYDESWV